MRLVSYSHQGRSSYGAIVGDSVLELATAAAPTLRDALAAEGVAGLKARADACALAAGTRIPLSAIRYLQPITQPDKILCVGLNYHLHAEEAGMAIPKNPSIFVRFPGAQVGHKEATVRPRASEQFDYEAELAVIIGSPARHVTPERGMDHVAGYACFAENSLRDWQKHTAQATPGKNFQASGAFGPWITTADEIPDPKKIDVIGRLNGVQMQRDSVANMIFTLPEMIAYMSTFLELLPGDVIVTGTPAGVGFTRKPPLYLKPGDVFEVECTGVGILSNPVVDEV